MSFTTTEKLFHQLHHCMNLLHRGHHGRHGMPDGRGRGDGHRGQGRVMRVLMDEQDGISQRDLAEKLQIRPPSLSEVLDKLAEGGLVERHQSESDRRMSTVCITEKGRAFAEEIRSVRAKRSEELLAGLSSAEREALCGLLGKLIVSLEADAATASQQHTEDGDHGGERERHAHRHGHHHGDGHDRHHHHGEGRGHGRRGPFSYGGGEF